MNNVLDGVLFKSMVLNGLRNLMNHEKEINDMNVFPVADGDTGTNMRLTIENGFKKAGNNKHLGKYLKALSNGMLLGARGNSGVILSQIFKGIYMELSDCSIANPREFRNALIRGYRTAYSAVINPVEGTILTVSRLGIENIKTRIAGSILFSTMFSMYLNELISIQKTTPELLPELKKAGVLDSGAEGYIRIIEGMYKCLIGQKIEGEVIQEEKVEKSQQTGAFFNENSNFEKGYCMEFILQLMVVKNYQKTFNLQLFIETLKLHGNSLVVLQDETIVKVHIHTHNPANVIDIARNYGEFISFKLENMQLQHNEYMHEKQEGEKYEEIPHKEVGIIAVADGDGVSKFLKYMGVDIIVSGGQSMNTSAQEFVNALKAINSDHVIVFPNNENIIESAHQAVNILKLENVEIIPTKSILECYYALAMDIPDADYEARFEALKEGSQGIISLALSTAKKEYSSEKIKCSIGDKVGILYNDIVVSGKDTLEVFKELIAKVEDIDDKVGLIIFKGKDFDESLEEEMNDFLMDNYSFDVQFIDGGQRVYELLIGVI